MEDITDDNTKIYKHPSTAMDTHCASSGAGTSTSSDTLTIDTGTMNSKTLKRFLSVPLINIQNKPASDLNGPTPMVTRAVAAARGNFPCALETSKKNQTITDGANAFEFLGKNMHMRSNPSSREVSPTPMFNLFAPRVRRYSASYSPLGYGLPTTHCLTSRVSQLRQEECIDMNSREVNHERQVHSAMQISQSWEDLTLVTENWSCKSDELTNPLQVVLPGNSMGSSSPTPSPSNNRAGLRIPYSPSPTRRTFATRRSMSPIAMRPSQLGPVKRKFELDDNNASNWNYSTPPLKKLATESCVPSPYCQSPSFCPSPDSGIGDGRITPKLFISKLCTTNTNSTSTNSSSSGCPSPISGSSCSGIPSIDVNSTNNIISNSSTDMTCMNKSLMQNDEGIAFSYSEDQQCRSSLTLMRNNSSQPNNDMQEDGVMMDDAKSETSSIGGYSTVSLESSSCDSGAKTAATFLNKLCVDEGNNLLNASQKIQKSFFINKQGISGAKKFIVNHASTELIDNNKMSGIAMDHTMSNACNNDASLKNSEAV